MVENIVFGILFALPLVAASVADIRTLNIPNAADIAILILGTARIICGGPSPPCALFGLLLCGVPMLIMSLITNGIGGGDIKLLASAGFFLGLHGAFTALFASLFLFLCTAGILKLCGKFKKTAVPFAPFIAAGALISYTFILLGVIAN